MDKIVVKNNFSKSAATYDKYAVIQRSCAEMLLSLCPAMPPERVLEVGCGTGFYTALLEKKYHGSSITAVDISGAMIEVARGSFFGENVEFVEADAETADLGGTFDLITSNASLHWFDDPGLAFGRFAGMLSVKGELLFSMYGSGTFAELNDVLSGRLGKRKWLYASGFMDKEKLDRSLSGSFSSIDIQEKFYEQECDSLLDFIKGMKLSGTNGKDAGNGFFMGKELLKELEALYIRKYGSIKVTHHVFFVRAGGAKR